MSGLASYGLQWFTLDRFNSSIKVIIDHFYCSFVGRFMTRRERVDQMGDRAKKFTNVYVKNFGESFTDEKLRVYFEQCGPISSCKVRALFLRWASFVDSFWIIILFYLKNQCYIGNLFQENRLLSTRIILYHVWFKIKYVMSVDHNFANHVWPSFDRQLTLHASHSISKSYE